MTTATITSNRPNMRAEAKGQMSAEVLTRDAGRILYGCGVHRSRSWVSQTVRTYIHLVESKGVPFGAYLLNRVQLNAEQRRRAMQDPELHNFLCYSDPTGETAVRNVMRRHG